jgi:hypothetical protein
MVETLFLSLYFNLDGFLLYLLRFKDMQIQHAVFERSLDVCFIDIVRQGKTPGENSERSFDPMEFFPFFFFFLFPLSSNRQQTVIDCEKGFFLSITSFSE